MELQAEARCNDESACISIGNMSAMEREVEQLTAGLQLWHGAGGEGQHGMPAPSSIGHKKMLLLRSSVVHNIQLERGATAAWVSSGGSFPYFCDLVAQCRTATDAALDAAVGVEVVRELLRRQRVIADLEVSSHASDEVMRPRRYYSTVKAYINVIARGLEDQEERLRAQYREASELLITFSRIKECGASAAIGFPAPRRA